MWPSLQNTRWYLCQVQGLICLGADFRTLCYLPNSAFSLFSEIVSVSKTVSVFYFTHFLI